MAAVVVAGTLLGGAATAEAKVPPLLKPGTRDFFATFSFGPAININDSPTQFKMIQNFGYHLFGGMTGPAIGGSIAESFGDNAFTFQLGPKFWWDFQLVSGLGLYLAPMAQMGFALTHFDGGRFFGGQRFDGVTRGYFNFQFGVEARLVLGNRGIVYWQPMAFDILAGSTFGARYDMMFGGGVIF